MASPASSSSYFPSYIREPFTRAYNTCAEYIAKAEDLYKEAEDKVIRMAENVLPENLRPLIQKVGRVVPEALFTASMITGTLPIAALTYTGFQLAWVITPFFKNAVQGLFSKESMEEAAKASRERLETIHKRFQPAIFLACGVGAVWCTVFGMFNFDPFLVMKGLFLGMLSYTGYDAMEKKEQVNVPPNPPADGPTIIAAENPPPAEPEVREESTPPAAPPVPLVEVT